MLQRIIAAVLAVLGLAAIALGIASATVWRADDTLTATARTGDDTSLMTTAPGVLELTDPPVTVRATADDGTPVVLALGRDTDVSAWIGADAHTVVTGLTDWHTLATDAVPAGGEEPAEGEAAATDEAAPSPTSTEAAAPAEASPTEPSPSPSESAATDDEPAAGTTAPDPAGSDLWIEEVTGDGTAELVWTPRDGRWTLLAAATGEDPGPLTLELSWPQTVTTPWLVPGVAGGAVLLLIAGVLALRSRRGARREPSAASADAATTTTDGEDAR